MQLINEGASANKQPSICFFQPYSRYLMLAVVVTIAVNLRAFVALKLKGDYLKRRKLRSLATTIPQPNECF